jgi:hypothetical protein
MIVHKLPERARLWLKPLFDVDLSGRMELIGDMGRFLDLRFGRFEAVNTSSGQNIGFIKLLPGSS